MNTDDPFETIRQNVSQELRRGFTVLAALSRLKHEQYGYQLLKNLNEYGFAIDQNTLYPLLRRLEDQGLLNSDWKIEGSRPRRYYKRTDLGKRLLLELKQEVKNQLAIVEELYDE